MITMMGPLSQLGINEMQDDENRLFLWMTKYSDIINMVIV